jgi:hypothetical protein
LTSADGTFLAFGGFVRVGIDGFRAIVLGSAGSNTTYHHVVVEGWRTGRGEFESFIAAGR